MSARRFHIRAGVDGAERRGAVSVQDVRRRTTLGESQGGGGALRQDAGKDT